MTRICGYLSIAVLFTITNAAWKTQMQLQKIHKQSCTAFWKLAHTSNIKLSFSTKTLLTSQTIYIIYLFMRQIFKRMWNKNTSNFVNYTQSPPTCLPPSRISTVALSTRMVKSAMVPLLRSLPKNCSVPSVVLSTWIGTRTTVESDWGGKLTGTAFALVIPVKSFAAVAEEEQE